MVFDKFENKTIVIPLNLRLNYPCDYINQTSKILSKNNSVILFDYHNPYSLMDLLKNSNSKKLFNSLVDISRSKKIIFFRAMSVLPFNRLKIVLNINKSLGFSVLSVFLWLLKKKVIIWQFSNLITKKIFNKHFFIYDCIDHTNSTDKDDRYLADEKKIFGMSNLISFNSKSLFENKFKKNPTLEKKSIITVCGCDIDLFRSKVKKLPDEYKHMSEKKVIFIGVFDFRVEADLLNYVIVNNRDKKFVFIGLIKKNVPKLFNKIIKEKNVLYLGKKEKNELPFYLKNSDLGMIPYDTKSNFVKYSNPMKAYEYLASGLPIASTDILALRDYPHDIVYTTDDKELFSQAIKKLTNNWNNRKITIAENIAEKNSWENKINLIKERIKQNEKTI